MDEGEKKARRWQPLPFLRAALNKIELSPARESQRVRLRLWAVMLGCRGCKWEKEREGEVACGYLTGEAVSMACRDGRGVLGVHWQGWAVVS
jgi:hypothetical protein